MKMPVRKFLLVRLSALLLTGSLCFSGCLSEITLEVPEENSSSIAIRGALRAGETTVVSIQITRISNFNASDIPEPVVGASVVLIDEFNRRLDIPMVDNGIYELLIPDNTYELEVKTGNAYQLSVATPNGKTYLSTFEPLNAVPDPIEIKQARTSRDILNEVGNIESQEFVRFLLTTPLLAPNSGGRSYLKWDFVGTYRFLESTLASPFPPNTKTCYIFEELNLENTVVFNGAESNQEVLTDFFLLEEPFDFRFSDGFYLTTLQQSLSEGAYQYWENIGKIIELSGNFFEAPPGKINGNFQNVEDAAEEVFGYFYATEEKTIRYFLPPPENRPTPYCPNSVSNADSAPAACLDCLLRPGSTLIKPDFWEE